tara:strand:- start:209 stop:1024 length:816 start_codon:yes stop_codon:yes gene_type:complete
MPNLDNNSFKLGDRSGLALVDLVISQFWQSKKQAWSGKIDSSELYFHENKLGLGSSSAVLLAWAKIFLNELSLRELITIHRNFQNNLGSGIDLAVSKYGGIIVFKNCQDNEAEVDSVKFPSGIFFSIIYTGVPVLTKSFIINFNQWKANNKKKYSERITSLGDIIEKCCSAIRENDVKNFLQAISLYNSELDNLGSEAGINIVSKEHRDILVTAKKYDLDYKVSGSGGGDIGIVFSDDKEALEKFNLDVGEKYKIINLEVDYKGLDYMEHD